MNLRNEMEDPMTRLKRGMTLHRNELTFSLVETELDQLAGHINSCLKGNSTVAHLVPVNTNSGGKDLCMKLADGLLLAALCNSIPGYEDSIPVYVHEIDFAPDIIIGSRCIILITS